MELKEALYAECLSFVDTRLQTIQSTIARLQHALLSETKSSAGDKHETGRAMLQLEREKTGHQLAEIQKVKAILTKVDVSNNSKTIGLGSLVNTSKANYFLAISVGEIRIDSQVFFAISMETPIAQLLKGKTAKDQIEFRNEIITIDAIN